jgi:hypothetical protein
LGTVIGINYEGGKPIVAAAASSHCRGAFNCQVAMDAPFVVGQDAPEAVRANGRAESQLGVNDSDIIAQLVPVFSHVQKTLGGLHPAKIIVIQVIARVPK